MNDHIPTAFVLGPLGFREVSRLNYRPPAWFDEEGVRPSWDAPAMQDDCRAVLPLVAELLHRLVPGAPVHILPKLDMGAAALPNARESETGVGGHAVYRPHGIVLSCYVNPWRLIDLALHEAWHLVEHRMSPADRRLCHAAVSRGLPMPAGYYDDIEERSARSFAAWAQHRLSLSWTPPAIPAGARTAEQVYAEVLAGRYRPWSGMVVARAPRRIGLLTRAVRWLARGVLTLTGDYTAAQGRTAP